MSVVKLLGVVSRFSGGRDLQLGEVSTHWLFLEHSMDGPL